MITKQEALSLCIDDTAERAEKIQQYVMDQTQSYEDRLEVWKATPEHLQYIDSWVWTHPTMADEEWQDTDNWSRYQDIDLVELPSYYEDYDESQEKMVGWPEEKLKKFYLGCMDEGIWGFNFDW